ncbi:SRPBCC family protein (plasmid) [Streptomyces sp. BI20]|uniref:SRPBCC family protein n=1 Tax=Streptomyces sp. BI20 TaxID=3403460 RepID=UPI003C712E94
MRAIATEILLPASPEEVWEVLVDLDSYAEWNPFIREASGTVAVGERLRLRMFPENGRPTSFTPKVLVAEPGVELRWVGNLIVPGVFDGTHHFRLHATGDGGTRLEHGEEFRGLLVPFVGGLLDGTRRNFEAMNQALALRVPAGN